MTVVASRLVIGVAPVFVRSPTVGENVRGTAQKDKHCPGKFSQLHDVSSIAMQPKHSGEMVSILD